MYGTYFNPSRGAAPVFAHERYGEEQKIAHGKNRESGFLYESIVNARGGKHDDKARHHPYYLLLDEEKAVAVFFFGENVA